MIASPNLLERVRRGARGVVTATLTLVALLCAASPSVAQENDQVRLELRDRRIITGLVFDLRDGELEVRERQGAVRIAKRDVLRWTFVPGKNTEARPTMVILKSGHTIFGNVDFSPDRGEVVVEIEAGSARYPADQVLRVVRPSGRANDGTFTPRLGFEDEVANTIDKVVKADQLTIEPTTTALQEIGFWAIPAIEEAIAAKRDLNDRLLRILHREQLRVYVPAKIAETQPEFLKDITSGVPRTQRAALQSALLDGVDVYGVMASLVLDDEQDAELRTYCIQTLQARSRIAELARAYQSSRGRAQLALAVALGDLGIYAGIPTLVESLRLDNIEARRLASGRLREYTGEDFRYDPETPVEDNLTSISKWEEWYRKNEKRIEKTLAYALDPAAENPSRVRASEFWREGNAAWQNRDLTLAKTLYQRAVSEDPTCAPPFVCLGIISYQEERNFDQAIKWFRRALKLTSAEGERGVVRLAYYHLGQIYRATLNFEMARQALRKAVEIDPEYADAWYDLGDVIYRDALSMSPRTGVEERRGRFNEAAETWTKGYETLHDYRKSLVLIRRTQLPSSGNLPFSAREHNMSLRDLKIELSRLEARFAHRLAQVQLALGNRPKALEWVEKAVASPKPESLFHETHARILASMGRSEEAAAARAKAKESDE